MNLKAIFEAEFEWINRLSDEDPWLGPAWEYPDGYPIPEDWLSGVSIIKACPPRNRRSAAMLWL